MRLSIGTALLLSSALAVTAGCMRSTDASETKLRDLTKEEALADFHDLVGKVKAYYGPLTYKERRFNYKLDELVKATEAEILAGKGDAEYFGAMESFLARFSDGHVGIEFPDNATGARAYMIPIFITPVEGKALVGAVMDDAAMLRGVEEGDELLTIDGKSPWDLLPAILRHVAIGNAETEKHFIYEALIRPFSVTELRPTASTAMLTFKKPNGRKITFEAPWQVEAMPRAKSKSPVVAGRRDLTAAMATRFNGAARASLLTMGDATPFFATPQVRSQFNFKPVAADAEHLTKFGVTKPEQVEIYAATYTYQGKKVLLVRQATYAPGDWDLDMDYLKAYKAILDQYGPDADVLVLDQTHNPGGSYCAEFYRLFIGDDGANNAVQYMHADRKWIKDFAEAAADPTTSSSDAALYFAYAHDVEAAYDAGQPLTSTPLGLFGDKRASAYDDFHWKKPMLVLVDELAGSCGDIFPMLVKENRTAKIFGKRTMGLGGNVESVGTLVNSGADLRLTRGLYTTYRDDGIYGDDVLMENHGVEPDYPYEHTAADFRAGFVGYVDAFSKKALEQIPAP